MDQKKSYRNEIKTLSLKSNELKQKLEEYEKDLQTNKRKVRTL